jgi:hypothetical protein
MGQARGPCQQLLAQLIEIRHGLADVALAKLGD